jgi:ABC-2 type transport system permease protein
MSTRRLLVRQLAYEQRIFWRNPGAVFFTLGLPVLMLAIFISLNRTQTVADGRSFGAYFVPGMLVFGLINSTYGYVATKLVTRRDSGLLKRIRATPLPLPALLAAAVANAVAVAVAITALVLAAGRVLYGVALPTHWGLALAVLAVGSVSFAALGLALATVIPNPDAADPIVFATVLPLLFISGVFEEVPTGSVLNQIAQIFPVRHLFQAALATTGSAHDGHPYRHLSVVASWGAAAALVALRKFRWETPH